MRKFLGLFIVLFTISSMTSMGATVPDLSHKSDIEFIASIDYSQSAVISLEIEEFKTVDSFEFGIRSEKFSVDSLFSDSDLSDIQDRYVDPGDLFSYLDIINKVKLAEDAIIYRLARDGLSYI